MKEKVLGALNYAPKFIATNAPAGVKDPFESASSLFTSTTAKFVGIGAAIAILILVVYGIVYGVSGPDGKKKAKEKFKDILVMCIVVFGGSSIVGFVVDFLAQSGFGGQ